MKNKKKQGFTLIELMITISIIVILLIIGVPSITALMEKTKLKTAASSMNNAIQLARSEAIKRNSPVTFTLNNEQWNVMHESEIIALSQFEISSTITPNISPAGASTLTFDNLGMLKKEGGLENIKTITLTSSKTDYRLLIKLTNSGASRVCNPDETGITTSIIGCN